MKLEKLEKVVSGMTAGPWSKIYSVSDGCEGSSVWIEGPNIPHFEEVTHKDREGIAVLRNHAELFLELVKECSGIEHYDYCCGEKCVCRIGKIEKVLEELEGLGD